MILKASQRGGSKQLGLHLLKTVENEHVEIHDVRGFIAEDVMGAMHEAYAVSRGTKCRQHLFSVSLSPPATESVRTEVFEGALAQIEERTGLAGQPRIVVFHEKEGRRHCHAVWSRIDAENMKAVPLSHFKSKLRDISRQLYLENGWTMPRGLMKSAPADPRNFTLEQWQQAKRTGRNAGELKGIVQECWAVSDSRASFAHALEERGLFLARGDRRAHVAVTYEGEVLSIGRYINKRSKDVAARLGEPGDLRSVAETRTHIAGVIAPKLRGLMAKAEQLHQRDMVPLEQERAAKRSAHAIERDRMDAAMRSRTEAETLARAARFRTGLRGLWDRLRGAHKRIAKQNEMETAFAAERDRTQRHKLVVDQLRERHLLQRKMVEAHRRYRELVTDLHRDLALQREAQPDNTKASSLSASFARTATGAAPTPAQVTLRQPADRLREMADKDKAHQRASRNPKGSRGDSFDLER